MKLNRAKLKECIEQCWQCRAECQKVLFHHCLKEGDDHAAVDHVKIMIDCIAICQMAADFMTRGSFLHDKICEACASVCEACADSCSKIGGAEMEHCAEICYQCAASCRDMSAEPHRMAIAGVVPGRRAARR